MSVFNIVSDVQRILFPNGDVLINVEQVENFKWMINITRQNRNEIGRVELFRDFDPEFEYVASIFDQGPVSRRVLDNIIGAIMDRL